MASWFMKLYYALTIPVSILFLLHSNKICAAYKLNWFQKDQFRFAGRPYKHSVPTGTSFKLPW